MTTATLTSLSFIGDGTENTFLTNLNTAMTTAGFTTINTTTTGTTQYSTYSYQASTATYGTMYLQFAFLSTATSRLYSGSSYTSGTNTFANATSNSYTTTVSLNNGFIMTSVLHPEVRGVLIFTGGSTTPIMFVGYLRPLVTPSWWSESNFPFAFICAYSSFTSNTLLTISTLVPSAISYTSCSLLSISNNTSINSNNGNVRALFQAGITSNNVFITQFSADVVIGAANSMNALDVFQVTPGVQEYTLLEPGSSSPSKLAVRTI